jgi:hypothetical protein
MVVIIDARGLWASACSPILFRLSGRLVSVGRKNRMPAIPSLPAADPSAKAAMACSIAERRAVGFGGYGLPPSA